ncbi:hypothetical protein [Streptomyces vinaceus]|uniref:hypothetical protein n=1 Tax=Streptomyces vinaceus TaxID=1960 RepID=UPI0038187A4A
MGRAGGRDVSILLQDYAQELLVPLPVRKLHVGQPEPVIEADLVGRVQVERCR